MTGGGGENDRLGRSYGGKETLDTCRSLVRGVERPSTIQTDLFGSPSNRTLVVGGWTFTLAACGGVKNLYPGSSFWEKKVTFTESGEKRIHPNAAFVGKKGKRPSLTSPRKRTLNGAGERKGKSPAGRGCGKTPQL